MCAYQTHASMVYVNVSLVAAYRIHVNVMMVTLVPTVMSVSILLLYSDF